MRPRRLAGSPRGEAAGDIYRVLRPGPCIRKLWGSTTGCHRRLGSYAELPPEPENSPPPQEFVCFKGSSSEEILQ